MGDSVKEIEDVVAELQKFAPIISGIAGTFIPNASGVTPFLAPLLKIMSEVLNLVETLKTSGVSHADAASAVGNALTNIGQTISTAATQPVASPPPAIDFSNRIG